MTFSSYTSAEPKCMEWNIKLLCCTLRVMWYCLPTISQIKFRNCLHTNLAYSLQPVLPHHCALSSIIPCTLSLLFHLLPNTLTVLDDLLFNHWGWMSRPYLIQTNFSDNRLSSPKILKHDVHAFNMMTAILFDACLVIYSELFYGSYIVFIIEKILCFYFGKIDIATVCHFKAY